MVKEIQCDYVLVRVPSEINEFIGSVKDEQGNEVKLVVNHRWNPTHYARISGEVIAIPKYLSGQQDPLYEIYRGSPKPVPYRSGDYIQNQIDQLPEKHKKKHNFVYSAGLHTPEFKSLKEEPVEVPLGSTVYFHYNNLLNVGNYMGREENGDLIYKIPYHTIFCYVVKDTDQIVMINNYVLVSPYYEDDTQEISIPKMEGMEKEEHNNPFGKSKIVGKMKGDLVVSLGEERRFLTGVLRHIGRSIGPDKRDLQPTQLIMYRPGSEFINIVGGEKYFVMRQTDLVATWIEDSEIEKVKKLALLHNLTIDLQQIVPVGDFVMISPEIQHEGSGSNHVLYDPNNPNQKLKQGDLLVLGHHLERTKKVSKFGIGKLVGKGENCIRKHLNKRVMFEKSGFYLYVKEFNMIFIREEDVYGYFE